MKSIATSLLCAALVSTPYGVGAMSALSFVPKLSTQCASSLSTVVANLQPNDCGPVLQEVITSTSNFTSCTSATTNSIDCFDYMGLMGAGQVSKLSVPVYRLANQSTCQLCTENSGMIETCEPLLKAVSNAVYGRTVDYPAFNITAPSDITRINALITQAAADCIAPSDQASVQILQFQSQVLCGSSNKFGMTLTTSGTLPGVVDLRSMVQCGQCAVVPCTDGQLCNGDGMAKMCPAGSYCPTTDFAIECPEGYFCPLGSTTPQKCSGWAAYSCGKGSSRQVVWLPQLIALIIIGLVAAGYSYDKETEELVQRILCYGGTHINFRKVSVSSEDLGGGAVGSHKSADSALVSVLAKTAPVSIAFNDITLVTGKTVRISGVSGHIRPGKFTAILGGSGAGKTSLMNVILGREHRTTGTVRYTSPNYKEGKQSVPSALLDRIVAFVPQNDVYLREMTVYELITHSACCRLPTSLTQSEVKQRVESVLEQLGLQSIRDVAVGAAGNSAGTVLSPGDRKLVNIALELVAGPNILFLDEPTTGIDSSSALNVARIVNALAHVTGLTCVAVIHQPRAEIFELIDDMIILVRGGKIAYQGPAEHAMGYFAMQGCVADSRSTNKTDFLIDITSTLPKAANGSVGTGSVSDFNGDIASTINEPGPSLVTWPDLWIRDGENYLKKVSEMKAAHLMIVNPSNETPSSHDVTLSNALLLEPVALDTPRPGFLRQLYRYVYRGVLQHLKHRIFLNDMLMNLIGGAIMGIVTCGGPLFVNAVPGIYTGNCPPGAEDKCNRWLRFEIGPSTFLIVMILGSIAIPLAIRTFGREKEVFSREAAVGANKAAYFLGKVLSDVPFLAVNVFVFMAPMIAIAQWRSPTDKLYSVLFCIGIAVTSMGYFLSFVFSDPDSAVLTGVILAVLLNLFSGFVPGLGLGIVGRLMYTQWAARAISAAELVYGQGLSDREAFNQVVPDEWWNPDLAASCGFMVLIGVVLQVVAFGLLLYKNRRASTF